MREYVDTVRDVQASIVVGIRGVLARERSAAAKEGLEEQNRVVEREPTGQVDVTPNAMTLR